MVSSELKAFAEALRAQQGLLGGGNSIAEKRQQMEVMSAQMLELGNIEGLQRQPVEINGVPCAWIGANEVKKDRALIYFHGGGYAMGSIDTHFELMGRLSRHCQARVLGVDYRLAPEHAFPCAIEDALKSYLGLLAQGFESSQIVLGGDSAGAGLVMATLLSLRDQGLSMPAGAVLMSPWTDLMMTGESLKTRIDMDPMLKIDDLYECAKIYCADAEASNTLISPVYADLTGMPPLLIQVGDHELLLNDASRLANNARAAGVSVEYQVWDEAFHVFQTMPHLPEADEALTAIGTFFRQR